MNYNIELKHQEKDNQLTISIHVEDLPINCLKNLEYIKEDAEKAVTFYLADLPTLYLKADLDQMNKPSG